MSQSKQGEQHEKPASGDLPRGPAKEALDHLTTRLDAAYSHRYEKGIEKLQQQRRDESWSKTRFATAFRDFICDHLRDLTLELESSVKDVLLRGGSSLTERERRQWCNWLAYKGQGLIRWGTERHRIETGQEEPRARDCHDAIRDVVGVYINAAKGTVNSFARKSKSQTPKKKRKKSSRKRRTEPNKRDMEVYSAYKEAGTIRGAASALGLRSIGSIGKRVKFVEDWLNGRSKSARAGGIPTDRRGNLDIPDE